MNVNHELSKTSRVHYQATCKTNPLVPQSQAVRLYVYFQRDRNMLRLI